MPASKSTRSQGAAKTKLVFAKPHSFVVEGKDFTETPSIRSSLFPVSETTTTESRGTNVRLRSSVINIPNSRHCPQFVKYRCSTQPTQEEIREYIDQAEIGGFDVGTVVARRWGISSNWRMPQLWGMIMMVRNTHINHREPWAPFLVKWLNNGTAEPAWGEDLLVIVPSMSDTLVQELVETQMDIVDIGDDDISEPWGGIPID